MSQCRFRAGQRGAGGVHRNAKLGAIDGEQQLSRFDGRPVLVALPLQDPACAGANIGVHVAVETCERLDIKWYVPLDDGLNHDGWRRGRGSAGLTLCASSDEYCQA